MVCHRGEAVCLRRDKGALLRGEAKGKVSFDRSWNLSTYEVRVMRQVTDFTRQPMKYIIIHRGLFPSMTRKQAFTVADFLTPSFVVGAKKLVGRGSVPQQTSTPRPALPDGPEILSMKNETRSSNGIAQIAMLVMWHALFRSGGSSSKWVFIKAAESWPSLVCGVCLVHAYPHTWSLWFISWRALNVDKSFLKLKPCFGKKIKGIAVETLKVISSILFWFV